MHARLHDYEETRIIIPTYLAVCVFICGVLGWGFYQFMQPAQYSNPGVAAYKAPPGLGITSLPLTVAKNASDLEHTADEISAKARTYYETREAEEGGNCEGKERAAWRAAERSYPKSFIR